MNKTSKLINFLFLKDFYTENILNIFQRRLLYVLLSYDHNIVLYYFDSYLINNAWCVLKIPQIYFLILGKLDKLLVL